MAKKKKGMDLRKKPPASQKISEGLIRFRWPLLVIILGAFFGLDFFNSYFHSFIFSVSEFCSMQLTNFTAIEESLKILNNSNYNLIFVVGPFFLYWILHAVFTKNIGTIILVPVWLSLTVVLFIGLNGAQEVIYYIYAFLFFVALILTIVGKHSTMLWELPVLIILGISISVFGNLWINLLDENINSIKVWYFLISISIVLSECFSIYLNTIKGLKEGKSKAGAIAVSLQIQLKYFSNFIGLGIMISLAQFHPKLNIPFFYAQQALLGYLGMFLITSLLWPSILTLFPLQRLKSSKRKV